MKTFTKELPALYGDHHVVEVRRILLEIPGVQDVYASSAFQAVEVTYDPEKTGEEEILARLEQAGYLGELPVPVETGAAAQKTDPAFMRHTQTYEASRQVISFTQSITHAGRPLWPCPGIGVVKKVREN